MVAEAGGVLLVPSFAIGRTQEVVWELDRLIERGEIPLLPLYLDSPMASKASDVYRRHPDYYDEETAALLRAGATPLDYPNQIITNDVKPSQAIAQAPRPYMIVASNGMLTGGRVVGHLRDLIDDPTATILFVGYQGEGTLGSHLQAGAETVKLDGQVRPVRCQIRSISGFSAHADERELLDWLARFAAGKRPGDPGFPRRVFLVHGDPEAQIALEPKVRALGFATHVPHWHERVTSTDVPASGAEAERNRATPGVLPVKPLAIPSRPTRRSTDDMTKDRFTRARHRAHRRPGRLLGPSERLDRPIRGAIGRRIGRPVPGALEHRPRPTSAAAGTRRSSLADSALGKILVDAAGMTLYMFAPDDGRHAPTCCRRTARRTWPALIATGTPTAGDGRRRRAS